MPRNKPCRLSLEALRCLQRVSQTGPDAVPSEAMLDLTTAAGKLYEYTFENCFTGKADHVSMLPEGLVSAFVTAATKLTAHIKQQQQRQQELSHQQQMHLAAVAAGILYCFVSIGTPYTPEWLMALKPAIAPAAQLALAVLTGPHGGLAPNTSTGSFSLARRMAANTVALVSCCTEDWGNILDAEMQPGSARRAATCQEAVFVSDVVQRAMLLNCAVFVYAGRQQQQQKAVTASSSNGSSNSWAPREAERLLQQLQFPLGTVQHYTVVAGSALEENRPLLANISDALTRFDGAINARLLALQEPDWAARYAGSIAAAGAGAGIDADDIDHATIKHLTCPGFSPAQIVYLTLEYMWVLGPGLNEAGLTSMVGLQVMSVMLGMLYAQVGSGLCSLEPAAQQAYAEGCVEYIWSGLGKQLQQAAGVAEAELEGDGSQPAAAADSSRSRFEHCLVREGVEVDIPANAAGRLRMLWEHFGACLLTAVNVYAGRLLLLQGAPSPPLQAAQKGLQAPAAAGRTG